MSNYELTLVFREETKAAESQAKTLVTGKIISIKDWGVKDLAYPIKGKKRGQYLHLEIELEPDQVAGLEKILEQNETLLRYLLISQH